MNSDAKRRWLGVLLDAVMVVVFAAIAFFYFHPAVTDGKVLRQGDISAGIGAGQEQKMYYQQTGERSRWTNALFSGMPTYQLTPSYNSTDRLATVENAYHLWLPDYVWYIFAYLLGFYILLRAFNFRQYLAALGSILWAFSTYFLIIIAAGHIWKVMALAYLPPLIGGLILAYRGKYLWGLIVTAIFAALEIHANHIQMTYYYLFVILFMVIAFFIEAISKKRMVHFLKALGVFVLGGVLGVMINASNMYHTWQYSKDTMRGGSELAEKKVEVDNEANKPTDGLERSYITMYSYGIGETWSLMIPNVKGGTSMRLLGDNDAAKEEGNSHYFNLGPGQRVPYSAMFNQMPQYWEESMEPGATGTSGPVYVGAFVVFLFILGIFIVKTPFKWALLAATILSIMLAWGKNFMGLTDWFIDNVPMYSKFRAVESILVIAEFCMPLMAMLALKRLIEDKELLRSRQLLTYGGISLAFTAGVCLLFTIAPKAFFDFTTQGEQQQLAQILPPADMQSFIASLESVRISIFRSDCLRSLLFIMLGLVPLILYRRKWLKALPTVVIIAVVCLIDLWMVNKRYLNNDMFQPARQVQHIRPMTDADKAILADKSLDYRVLSLENNVFNENETSFYHKSVGGYHAAKLARYQDLIDGFIAPEREQVFNAIRSHNADLSQAPGDSLWPVLNMLNTKYLLLAQQNFYTMNPWAQGNAWFVDNINYVSGAKAEFDGMKTINLRHEAVADVQFEKVLGVAAPIDSTASVVLNSYEPNRLNYTIESAKGGVVVFSEIYYPGWTATVDGQEVELGRVNYVLRAMRIDGGRHEVVLSFFPKSVSTTETLANLAFIILLLLIVGGIGLAVYRYIAGVKKK